MKNLRKFWDEWISPYSIHILNLILSVLLYFTLKIAGVYTWIQFAVPCVTAIISSLINTLKDIKTKEPINLITMSFNYMLEGGVEVDNILDILIENKLNKRVFKSSKSLFRVITSEIKHGDYEKKRLIAESISALYKINRKQTKSIIVSLRNDEPIQPWNDDIRRRVIEEFSYIGRRDKIFLIQQLEVKDDDSIYTILAILNTVFFHKIFSEKEKEKMYYSIKEALTVFGELPLKEEEWTFIEEVKGLADSIQRVKKDFQQLENCLTEAFNSTDNKYIRILISKNIHLVCGQGKACSSKGKCVQTSCQKHILNLFDLCFDKSNHKNVRRSMARETICHCLLHCLTQEVQFRKRITANIWRLVEDDDYIIPNTFLDYANILNMVNPELYRKVINYFTDSAPIVALIEQAQEIVPENMQPYMEIIKDTQWELYLKTIFYYLQKNKTALVEAEKLGENGSILYNKIRLKQHAERVDKNIQALRQYKDN